MRPQASKPRSTSRWLRWLIAVATLLASLVVPACSRDSGRRGTTPPGASTSRAPAAAARKDPARSKAAANAEKTPGSTRSGGVRLGPPRRHPFAPVNDPAGRRAMSLAGLGTLELKGIIQGATPTAIIAEGGRLHYVPEGGNLGNLTVLEVREDEVVLGAGRQKRVLSLYEPQGQTR